MANKFQLDLVFIRSVHEAGCFEDEVETELECLFSGAGFWYTEPKSTEDADVVVAEVRGIDRFDSEQQALEHIERNGSDKFWAWLQGYNIVVDRQAGGCSHCMS